MYDMKAVLYDQYGDPAVYKIGEVEEPRLNAGEALVEVKASSINPVDWKIRRGNLRLISGFQFPKVAGSDFAGIIRSSNIPAYKPGDKVYGMVNPMYGGAYAQRLKAKAENMSHQPANLAFHEAAAIPLAGLTALQTMKYKGGIRPGNHVLINACCGGVGHLAMQYCKAHAATVTGICSSSKVETAYQLGADAVIDYTHQDIYDHDSKYDIILDPIGNIDFYRMKSKINPKGTMISFGKSALNASAVVFSLFSGKKLKFYLTNPSSADLAELRQLIEAEKIRPLIHKIFPLSQIAEAHEESEKGHTIGKIVISVR